MPTKTMKATDELVEMHIDFFNDRTLDEGQRHVASDYECLDVPHNEIFHGSKGYVEAGRLWIDAFPDAKCQVVHLIAEGNRAALEFRGTGTHKGALRTPKGVVEPTGKKLDMRFVSLYEFKDEKLRRERLYYDAATMMKQLGLKA